MTDLRTDLAYLIESAMVGADDNSERAQQIITGLGLREHWAALDPDGTWTSGEDLGRADAEQIVAERGPGPRLAVRWESHWLTAIGTPTKPRCDVITTLGRDCPIHGPVNTEETTEDAARRLAGEVGRLSTEQRRQALDRSAALQEELARLRSLPEIRRTQVAS